MSDSDAENENSVTIRLRQSNSVTIRYGNHTESKSADKENGDDSVMAIIQNQNRGTGRIE